MKRIKSKRLHCKKQKLFKNANKMIGKKAVFVLTFKAIHYEVVLYVVIVCI